MNNKGLRWTHIVVLCLMAILIGSSGGIVVRAESSSPAGMLQQAWRNAQLAGSYRFISDIEQTLIPRPVPQMIGQQEIVLNLASDGAALLPDQAYIEMRVQDGQRSNSVVILRENGQSYMLQDGELKPVDESLNLASNTNDLLGYLAAADQVTLLDPPEGHPSLVRYGFTINGPRFAEYVRQQTETALQAQPGAPQGLTINPSPVLQQLTGRGELWVNQAGLPIRQVLDLEMPEITQEYAAHIRMKADFSSFGKVTSLPKAVQGPHGTWQLDGALQGGSAPSLGAFPGFGAQPAQAVTGQPDPITTIAGLKASLSSLFPLHFSPTSLIIFVVLLLVVLVVRYYRRNPKHCYALIVFTLIPIMVFSPLLQSAGVVDFMERQAQAAEERAAQMPNLLRALGFETQEIDSSGKVPDSTGRLDDSASDIQLSQSELGDQPKEDLSDFAVLDQTVLQQEDGDDLLLRCGDGQPGADTDADGLTDQVEVCLGTNPYQEDTDNDGIPDKVEIDGFDLGDKHWDSDPLKPDSNGDGILDTFEWNNSELTPNGQAPSLDVDGDDIPNLWDDDDDGDDVPDAHDLSPFALTDYTTVAALSTVGSGFTGYEFLEIQVQPQEQEHLRYATTALDWPDDHLGNVQDRDDSTGDLRLVPFLIVTANVAPDDSLADKYGFRSWLNSDGQYVTMASLSPVQDSGAVHSFYAKIGYAPAQLADIQWQAQMVWMAEMQVDYSEGWVIKTEPQTLHQYQDSFRITGLKVTKDEGYEAAVMGTPYQTDDLILFRLFLALNDTFKSYMTLNGQEPGETALQEISQRLEESDNLFNISKDDFNVSTDEIKMSGPITYGHMDAAMAGIGSELIPGMLENDSYRQYYENGRCLDAEGNSVNCASLIVAYESSMGVRDLASFPVDSFGKADLTQLHVNLADMPLVTTRGLQMRIYEQEATGWQVTTPARMLELVAKRYLDEYTATGMLNLYPNLTAEDVRFIAFAAYLWATSPSYSAVSIDGQALVDEIADEVALAARWVLPADEAKQVKNAVDFYGLGAGIAKALVYGPNLTKAYQSASNIVAYITKILDSNAEKSVFSGVEIGVNAAVLAASMIMGVIMAICKADNDKPICRNEGALKVANIVVQSLSILVKAKAVFDTAVKVWNTLKSVKLVEEALAAFSKVAEAVAIVGLVLSIAITWVGFILTLVFGGLSNPVLWRNALAEAIITTIYLLVIFAINCIPIIGQLITAIMALIDGLFVLFTWLFGDKVRTFATALLLLFYDAEVCVDIGDASFGEFTTSLADPEGGMVDGNTFILSVPFEGALYETGYGNADDLSKSTIAGRLTAEYDYYTHEELAGIYPFQDMSQPENCVIDHTIKYCSNTAEIGYLLTPRINGIVPVQEVVDYTIIWAELGGGGAWRWSTNTWSGILPEDSNKIQPEFMYLDVLPVDMNDLWTWSELTNHDPDGDGLTNEQEAALHTTDTAWDSDGDGLSDEFEWQAYNDYGTDPLKIDTDRDGLNDGLELRLGTFANNADSDGDGLTDGQEVRRYQDGAMLGGWQVTLQDGNSYWVSSNPMQADTDGDGLTDSEEKANGLSPNTLNQLVPELSMSVSPLRGVPGGRAGAYWQSNETVKIGIHLSNGSPDAVTSDLVLNLPDFLENVQVEKTEGDHAPDLTMNGNDLTWSFSGVGALKTYEYVDFTIAATTTNASGTGEIALSLNFGDIQMKKTFSAVMDGDNPEVAILAPAGGAYLRGSNYVVGGSAIDATTWVSRTQLSIVPTGSPDNFQTLEGSSSPWAYSWDLPSDGVYALKAYASDVMGNATTTEPVTVTVDNTDPTISLDYKTSGDTVQLSGTASDNLAGIAWVRLSIDGQPWRSVPLSGDSWSYDWTVGEGAQGEHQASVMAVDRSGNQSDVKSETITVDVAAPSSQVTGGADPTIPPAVKPNTDFTIAGVADEGGHLPPPAASSDLSAGMDVFDNSTLWLGISSIADNDGGMLAVWIGDFNADRLADLAVGLPGPQGSSGQVAILYGRAGGWPAPPDLEMLADSPTHYNGDTEVRLGSLLAAAGDANGDNFSDLLVGERASTRAFLVFGNRGSLGDVTLDSGHSGYRTLLQAPATIESLASAGDVNGDGYDDLLVRAGSTAYLLLGRMTPWPETVDVEAEAVASFSGVTGAQGVGDVNGDQLAEWVTMASGTITLFGWNTNTAQAAQISTYQTSDTDPHLVALGDVDADGKADWLYANGESRTLVYGIGATTRSFTGYDGFFAAPGDVDGDGRADILLATSSGVASLVHQSGSGSPAVFAAIDGVGGAANALYASGADLNSDGSADLLLIPTQAEAEKRGFDAPDFSSGFISPQTLPVGLSSMTNDPVSQGFTLLPQASLGLRSLALDQFAVLSSSSSDNSYVDDDGVCDGHTPCYTTIQDAIKDSDGGGDKITVYPGVYPSFNIPAGAAYDNLIIEGVSADAVFIEGNGNDAIHVAANGVHLSNLTVRDAGNGIALDLGGGEPPVGAGNETSLDHVLVHSAKTPISMSGVSALSISDSTLVGNGTDPILSVNAPANIYSWAPDETVPVAFGNNGTLVNAGGTLYALPGDGYSTIYQATPQTNGSLGSWSPSFSLRDPLPPVTSPPVQSQGENILVGGASTISQIHSTFVWPNQGGVANNKIQALAIDPATGDIYAGGRFTKIGSSEFFYLARWDGTKWNKMGTGLEPNGPVLALTFDDAGNLYAGGEFTKVGNKDVGHVARWNLASKSWYVLGTEGGYPVDSPTIIFNGVDGPVYALAYNHSNPGKPRLFIGGVFSNATDWGDPSTGVTNKFPASFITVWKTNCTPSSSSDCIFPDGNKTNGPVRVIASSGGSIYVGGSFTIVGLDTPVSNIAVENIETARWSALGSGLTSPVDDIAVLRNGRLAVASGSSIWEWDGTSTWSEPGGNTGGAYVAAVDAQGNVYTANSLGNIKIQPGGEGSFVTLADYCYFSDSGVTWNCSFNDLVVDSAGNLYGAPFGVNGSTTQGAMSRWAPASFFRRPASGGSWTRLPYPPEASILMGEALVSAVADNSDNLYLIGGSYSTGVLYFYDAVEQTWTQKVSPSSTLSLQHLLWASNKLYALGHTSTESWYLTSYDPASGWTQLAIPPIPQHLAAAEISWSWDGADQIYLLRGDGTSYFSRYSISANTWEWLWEIPLAVVADNGNNLYAIWGSYSSGLLYRYDAATQIWTQKANPDPTLALKNLMWVNNELFAAGCVSHAGGCGSWHLVRYDPVTDDWTFMADPPVVPNSPPGYLDWSSDRTAHIYMLRDDITNVARYSVSTNTWEWLNSLPSEKPYKPKIVTADTSDNLYAIWDSYSNSALYRYDAITHTWTQKASPDPTLALQYLAWANGKLYAAGYSSSGSWSFTEYNPGQNSWNPLANPPIPSDTSDAGFSWSWGGTDYIYMLSGGQNRSFARYSINTNKWESLGLPFGPALTRIGSYFYVYGAPGLGKTTNLSRYGSLPISDLRLEIDNTAFVNPDSATSFAWTNLNSIKGSYSFKTDIDSSNAWIAPAGSNWSPTLPTGAARLTSTQADFVDPQDGLYRLGAGSSLSVGYHHYKAVAYVYTSQSACTGCANGSLTWGVDAFAAIREAVESGAARVLVHPGRYPQTFYLVSGVEIIGSGAEATIIEPPEGAAATLVTAEGAAGSSLARLTLAGGGAWNGFLAEGSAKGLKLARLILRDLKTGIHLKDDSQVEIVNNTLVGNTDGIYIEGSTPVNVRNTILAYNSGTGLSYSRDAASLSNTYNDFWSNGLNISPNDQISLGSLFVDPHFIDRANDDLRLRADSSLIDKGAPTDPTLPGGGERVDIGYAEYNAAGFYVSHDYSETGLNDGLIWGIDAFDQIQPALDAAAAAMHDLQGALPEGGYSVAVDAGAYYERVTVPSHVRLLGSGPENTIIDAGALGSGVTFDGVIDSQLSGFTVQNAGAAAAGVEIKGAASGIRLERNLILNNAGRGVSLAGSSSAQVSFNTIVGSLGAGVYASGSGAWAEVRNNILDGNATGLQAENSAFIRNDYNLLFNTTDLSGVTAGDNTIKLDPLFAASTTYVPSAGSPAIDAADPLAEVPLAGGLRADLGYKELIASPLAMLFGPQVKSTVSLGSSGVAKVEVGVVPVIDAAQPVTATLPTTWQTITPTDSQKPLFYWSLTENQAASGFYRVYSRATDEDGNTEADENDWYDGAFVVDGTPPTVAWGTPGLPASTSVAAVLAVVDASGTVSTGTGTRPDVAQVYFDVTGPLGSVKYPAEHGKAWIPFPAVGSYSIKAVAIDEAGNQAQTTLKTVSVAAGSSVATLSSHNDNSFVAGTSLTLRGYVRFTGAGTGQVNVSVADGSAVQATLHSPGSTFSQWTAEITLPAGEGAKTFTITPSLNGVDGSPTILNLTLDTTAPALSVTSPASGATVAQTVEFQGTASDAGAGLAKVDVSMDGGYTWQPAALDSGAWSLKLEFTAEQDNAGYPARIRASDMAGNTTVVDRPLTVDSMPPTGLTPVTFKDQYGQIITAGQRLEIGSTFTIEWHTPLDAGGSVKVFYGFDNEADTAPSMQMSETSWTQLVSTSGEWYVHLMAQDPAGNQTLLHYGPWYVRDLVNPTFNARRHSIILDGYLDLKHKEWKDKDLLGVDARSGNPQELYASWDGQYVFLGWSGAWWTLDGVLWAYLDTASGGVNATVDGSTSLSSLYADQAVEINGPDQGSLWIWDGSAWVEGSLDFANGPSGDTEVRVPWPGTPPGSLDLIAFALPRQAQAEQPLEEQSLVAQSLKPMANNEMLALEAPLAILQDQPDIAPWAMFPTTNPLEGVLSEEFSWADVANVPAVNVDQPSARTVNMTLSSPQASGTAWGPGGKLAYAIQLTNPEPTAISNLALTLTATDGLSYQTYSGATCTACDPGAAGWSLSLASLGAGETADIQVEAQIASNLSGLQTVTSSFTLSAGALELTPESQATGEVTHRVDGQAPAVSIAAFPGSVIPAGSVTFTGSASDESLDGGDGSGVAYVKVSIDNGANWQVASGTVAWSAGLTIPEGTSEITLKALAVDKVGNTSQTTEQTFLVDTTPPEISWTVPDVITSPFAFFNGTTRDPAPAGALVDRVEVQLDGSSGAWQPASGLYAPDSNGIQGWTWTWLTPLDDGVTHQLLARAIDGAGLRTSTLPKTVVVDVIPPQITAAQQATLITLPYDSTGDPVITGTAADGSGVQGVDVLVYDPSGGASTQAAVVAEDGTWQYTPTVTGWKAGIYSLRVQAQDIHGNQSIKGPYQLEIKDAPITGLAAVNDGPRMIGDTLTFTATLSTGTNVVYNWDFGDESKGEGQVVTHTYTASADYTATVTATNSISTAITATPVTILALTVEAGQDQSVDEGDTVEIEATFTDNRTDVSHTATIDWGDATPLANGVVDENANTVTGGHAYADNGTYSVTVTVNDGQGHTAGDALTVTVDNVAPTATLTLSEPKNEGSLVTVSFTNVKDPGAADTLTYSFDWDNDGTFDILDQSDPSAQYTWFDNGSYTVQGMIEDDDGGSNLYTIEVIVENVVPLVNAGADADINEGGTFLSSGSFTDPGQDTWQASVDYGDGSGEAYMELAGNAFNLSHTYADSGIYTVEVCVTDDDRGEGCQTAQVTVNNLAPSLAASPESQTVQYSEPISEITFTAADVAADTMSAVLSWTSGIASGSGAPAGLTLSGGEPCKVNDGVRTCTWTLTGNVGMPAGDYTLHLAVTDKDGGTTGKDITLEVEPEQAAVSFDDGNDVAVTVEKPGGSSLPFSLRVCVSEPDVPVSGDISLAQVNMSLVPVGPGGPLDGVPVEAAMENGFKCVTFSFAGVPVNTYTVQVTVSGGYYTGYGEDVLVVYDPSLGFTTGGGWFYWPDTANPETGYPGDRTNFGYTMKYNKKGTNIQGSLLLIRHLPDGTIYRVKSNALYGLALGEDPTLPMGWASFSGKSTYMEPGWPEPIGNYEFLTYVEDNNEPGTGLDRFWIEVIDGLALPRPGSENAVPLNGGNLVVPHRAKK